MNKLAAILIALLVSACNDEVVDPLVTPTGSTTVPPPPDGTGGAPVDPGPRVRDVFLRNPFGGPPDNLLADGDFELSITRNSTGQYGWRRLRLGQLKPLRAETGGICKSGLRCGRVDSGDILIGTGTAAPNDADHYASIWLKSLEAPDDPKEPCALGDVIIYECGSGSTVDSLQPAAAPDENGWCQYETQIESSKVAICMYVDVGEVDILIDNAVLLPAPTRDRSAPPPSPRPPVAMRPAAKERMAAALDLLRRTRRFGAAPSSSSPEGALERED